MISKDLVTRKVIEKQRAGYFLIRWSESFYENDHKVHQFRHGNFYFTLRRQLQPRFIIGERTKSPTKLAFFYKTEEKIVSVKDVNGSIVPKYVRARVHNIFTKEYKDPKEAALKAQQLYIEFCTVFYIGKI